VERDRHDAVNMPDPGRPPEIGEQLRETVNVIVVSLRAEVNVTLL